MLRWRALRWHEAGRADGLASDRGGGAVSRKAAFMECFRHPLREHRGRRDRMEKCVGLGLGFLWVWVAWLAIREVRDILKRKQ